MEQAIDKKVFGRNADGLPSWIDDWSIIGVSESTLGRLERFREAVEKRLFRAGVERSVFWDDVLSELLDAAELLDRLREYEEESLVKIVER